MALRFRRSFRLFPGVRLNLSKSGVSTSFGRRGAWFTVGPRGTRETIGIPGTGLSYTAHQSPHARHNASTQTATFPEAPTALPTDDAEQPLVEQSATGPAYTNGPRRPRLVYFIAAILIVVFVLVLRHLFLTT